MEEGGEWDDVGGGREVPEPPLRIAKNVGFDSIVAVYLRGNDGYGDVKKAGRNCGWVGL